MTSRPQLVLALLACAAVGMLSRAAYLQLFHKDFLQDQGSDRYMRVLEVPALRGMIVDRHGDPLAVSSPVDSVWADPGTVLEHRQRLPALARLLGLDSAELLARLEENRTRQFLYLRKQMEPDAASRVMALGVPGVHLERGYRRFYPTAEVMSHLLGFTDIDDRGQEGLELAYDQVLRGTPGAKRVLKDRYNRIVEDVESISQPQSGQTLTLSIDRRIQYLAYKALKEAVLEHRASAGTALVLDVTSGEILAMVNQPAGNPNNREQRQGQLLRNRAVTDVFEPGSTFKPFVVALGLEAGTIRPNTPIDTRPGFMPVGRNTVRDIHNYGLLDVTRVITKSSNVGVAKIALALPPERLWDLYRRLGVGSRTALGFAGEQAGFLSHHKGWGAFEYATHSFGYGLSVTAVQLAQAYMVLATDGVRRPLTLLKREAPPAEEMRVLSPQTARQVRTMMETVVSREGTALKAAVPGYRVAGKTGTARKIIAGRYSSDHHMAVFAGMAPASQPRLVMVIMIDDPQGEAYYGGLVAAPVFSQVMAGALRLLNVNPDGQLAGTLELAASPKVKP
ncbi:MAG TPA: penicillin-binding transpeptidase domain-containing protein [Candidatus Competibacteraceae bacterium]|nr:penicillin-binding transpeptidase domain-containing protein [Candidatus Competibacteraceae bacterium]